MFTKKKLMLGTCALGLVFSALIQNTFAGLGEDENPPLVTSTLLRAHLTDVQGQFTLGDLDSRSLIRLGTTSKSMRRSVHEHLKVRLTSKKAQLKQAYGDVRPILDEILSSLDGDDTLRHSLLKLSTQFQEEVSVEVPFQELTKSPKVSAEEIAALFSTGSTVIAAKKKLEELQAYASLFNHGVNVSYFGVIAEHFSPETVALLSPVFGCFPEEDQYMSNGLSYLERSLDVIQTNLRSVKTRYLPSIVSAFMEINEAFSRDEKSFSEVRDMVGIVSKEKPKRLSRLIEKVQLIKENAEIFFVVDPAEDGMGVDIIELREFLSTPLKRLKTLISYPLWSEEDSTIRQSALLKIAIKENSNQIKEVAEDPEYQKLDDFEDRVAFLRCKGKFGLKNKE